MSVLKSTSRKQGRPARDMAGRVRTLAWFRAVQRKSGKSSLELGREFHPEDYAYDGEKTKTSHRWERYEAGTNSPVDNKNGNSLIDIVEEKYKGTAYWFRHPLWMALGDTPMDMDATCAVLLTLDPAVIDICFVPQNVREKTTLKRTPYDYGLPTRLSYLKSMDGLAALIILAKEAGSIGNGRMHGQVAMRISENLFYLKTIPEFFAVLEDVILHLNEGWESYQYHLTGDLTLPAPIISIAAVKGDGANLWPNNEYTALENQLLEQLQRLFNNGKMMRSWLETYHPELGETPMQAFLHPQGIHAVHALLKK